MAAVVGVSIFELQVPGSRGLKEKRKVIKSLIERIHQRFRVSVTETDLHDLHQRAEIGIAAVVNSDHEHGRLFDSIRNLIDSEPGAVLTRWDPQIIEMIEGGPWEGQL